MKSYFRIFPSLLCHIRFPANNRTPSWAHISLVRCAEGVGALSAIKVLCAGVEPHEHEDSDEIEALVLIESSMRERKEPLSLKPTEIDTEMQFMERGKSECVPQKNVILCKLTYTMTTKSPPNPILEISKHLFPTDPTSFYLNLNHSIQIDIYYNAQKTATDEWGFDDEKMRVWLEEWWVKRIFNMKTPTGTETAESEQQITENAGEDSESVPESHKPSTPVSDATKIMRIWKAFILQYSTVREEVPPAEPVPAPAATKKPAGKGAPAPGPEETKPKAPLYSIDDVRLMTEYLSNSLFQFYDLYEFVFASGAKRSTVEEDFCHIMQYPISIPPLIQFKEESVFLEEQQQQELEKQQRLEEQQAKEQERIEQARREREEREQREREDREAPRLSSEQLAEIASYLKFHLSKDLTNKEQSILERMQELQGRLEKQEERPASGKAAAKKK